MSKPISFGFGKPKTQANSASTAPKTSISFPSKPLPPKSQQKNGLKSSLALRADDDDDHDEEEPKLQELTGFGSSGAILSKPIEEKTVLVIENAGNKDWRRHAKGKNLLPGEVQAARGGRDVVTVEKNEVSKASGLQFAQRETAQESGAPALVATVRHVDQPKSVDDEALQALLNDDDDTPRGNAIIEADADARAAPVDTKDFKSFVASHPDPSTIEDYTAMPVEEFGMAMLRGMGKKRRANGEVIQLESDKDKKEVKKRKQEGFLGIGAKPVAGMEGIELGAWGKADMRKNNKGQGFFTPVMVRDAATGETITEEELERRKKESKTERDDWKDRRDKNLERNGRYGDDKYKDSMNGSSTRGSDRDSDYDSSRSRSNRHRSRSRSRHRRHRDDDRYETESSRRDRDRDRDRDHNRDRPKDRDRDYDRNDRRHKERR